MIQTNRPRRICESDRGGCHCLLAVLVTSADARLICHRGTRPTIAEPALQPAGSPGAGQYSTHELGIQPEAYDPHLDVDFSPLRGDGQPEAAGYGQAA